MLIRFTVSNFRSFLSEQALDFVASRDRSHEAIQCVRTRFAAVARLTRMAVVFGPNGSGKSNLLVALRTMRDVVLNSSNYSEREFAEKYTPFWSQSSKEAPTTFTVEVLLEGLRYRYAFSYDAQRIQSEDLHVYKSSKSQRWFARRFIESASTEMWTPFSPSFSGAREMWRKATGPRALYLTTAANLSAAALRPLFHWFEAQVDVALAAEVTDFRPFAARLQDGTFKKSVLEILRSVDMPVIDVRARVAEAPRSAPATPLPARSSPSIEFKYARHGYASDWLDAKLGSAGAQRLLTLLTPLIDGIEKDRLVAIDEFDTHLHPLVARFLVRLINEPSGARRRVQVILVSHTTTLMDLEVLRRDEVWLTDTDELGASRLISLPEHSPRKGERIAKAYLRGAYGSLPRLDWAQFDIEPRASAPQATRANRAAPQATRANRAAPR